MTTSSLDSAAEHLLRECAPQVLGAVIRRFGDFSTAGDAVQEALLAAAMQWPVEGVLSTGVVGPYQLQAAIAAIHDEAPRAEDTDWPQILALYGLLERMSDNPMVSLNRAIAVAMVDGPKAGLARLEALDSDPRLAGHYRLDAVRAHLLEMAGDHEAAMARYRAAAGRTTSIPERNYLSTKAAALNQSQRSKVKGQRSFDL